MDLDKKKYVIFVICLSILAVFIIRLAYLQLFTSDELTKESDRNSIKTITVTPPRGIMYDRNGNILVDNKPSYTVTITPNQFDKNILEEISTVLELSADSLAMTLKNIKGTNRFNPAKVKRDVDFRVISFIAENRDRLNGVDYQVEAIRYYPNNFRGSHSFGYCNEISPKQLEKQIGDYYKQGDMIGANGLESNYENHLRGVKGYQFITVDVKGREIGSLNEGKSDIPPVNGTDLILGMDRDLQELAEKLIYGKQGAIIAVDPRNGEILCFVSKPDFDLSAFSGKTDSKIFSNLLTDPQKPLFNRVIQTKYPPGSTWKMMMSLAALEAGIITTTSTISCPGSFVFGNRSFADHGSYGSINVVRALEVSANVFYYKLGLQVGIDNYHKYSKMFGFGTKTGIDIPNETSGLLPSREYFDKRYGENKWTQGLLVSLGIGQGELGVSPVQMVAYTAAIAMNGLYCQPHFVSKIRNSMNNEEEIVKYEQRRIDLPLKYYEAVRKGMFLVVNGNGTAARIKSDEIVLSGKTGTAQNSSGKNHSWFVGFAPFDDPRIAICVLGEFEGWGSSFGAPTAAALMLNYLGVSVNETGEEIKSVGDYD
ncbi:MAG: penicillin-binding protein 2 [Ignavibacteria bacterium]|nr:penicillin-binding protein 2 [Ignavibacteria bacterium]